MFKFGGSPYLSSAPNCLFFADPSARTHKHKSQNNTLIGLESVHTKDRFFFFSRRMKITRPILPTCSWLWWLTESEPGMLQLKRSEQQFAFKDLMTHLILQFALRIAFRGVLHRCGNQEIHRWKIHWIFFFSHWAEAWTGLGQTYEGENLETNARTTFETNTGECFCGYVCVNDPSAGSPTETLLRLLLPRNVQI